MSTICVNISIFCKSPGPCCLRHIVFIWHLPKSLVDLHWSWLLMANIEHLSAIDICWSLIWTDVHEYTFQCCLDYKTQRTPKLHFKSNYKVAMDLFQISSTDWKNWTLGRDSWCQHLWKEQIHFDKTIVDRNMETQAQRS